MADIVDTLKAWAAWYADNSSDMPSGSLPAAMLNAVTEIERLREAGDSMCALIDGNIEWENTEEESEADLVLCLWEEARRG